MGYGLGYLYWDPTMILLLPAILLSFIAQMRVQSAFSKYSRVSSRKGWTAAQVAQGLLRGAGIYNVSVERVPGSLTDHYDPRTQTLRLSESVYSSTSLAALGVAAHETGHAIQHDQDYFPIRVRMSMAPVVSFGSYGSWILLLAGMIFSLPMLIYVGIALFSLIVVFQLVTLPVELNASSRALALLSDGGYLEQDELPGARSVLNAAAWTYIAATLTAILQLLRLLLLFGGRRNNRD